MWKDGIVVEEPTEVEGCLDANADNYNADATVQAADQWGNLLCDYASCDDVPSTGCMYEASFATYHEHFGAGDCSNYGGTPCTSASEGCTDAAATNYDADATVQSEDQYGNLLCVYASCDDVPGGEGCMYAESYGAYHEEFTAENCETYGGTACGGDDGGDDTEEPVADVEGCLDANADNYNADATVQGLDQYGNIACNYSSCDDIPDAEGCYYAELLSV